MERKDAYYFPHDSNAKDDPKCMLLIDQLGLEGYGIYWVLIELLRDQPEYKYPLKLIPVIAKKYYTSKEKILIVIKEYDLFEIDAEQYFFSISFNERMRIIDEKRNKLITAGRKGGLKTQELKRSPSDASSVASRGAKARRVEESKVKESKEEKKREKKIYKLWRDTFGRIPSIPEIDQTKLLIDKFGYDKSYKIMYKGKLEGFHHIKTLINALDEQGDIKPKDKKNERVPRGTIDFDKYKRELATEKANR